MREFVSLLFAAALAAHLGPAGAPSLGTPPACADEVGPGARGKVPVLYPAAAVGATQAEVTTDGRERTSRPDPLRAGREAAANAPRVTDGGSSQPSDAYIPAWLLGFSGHPTTAPPLQA